LIGGVKVSERRRVVELLPYDLEWKEEFAKIKTMIDSYIGDLILRIEHVGSTSVEGLAAKPVIDIDVVIESYDIFPKIIECLEQEGYEHEGNLGVEGREVFKRRCDDGLMNYHLYVCPKDGKGYLEHIAFRDYLRENTKAREEYEVLKYKLAEAYRDDRDSYCNKKSEFVESILERTIYHQEKE